MACRKYFFLFLFLAGCTLEPYVPPASTAHYEDQLSVFKGKNIRELPSKWGLPAYTVPMPEGNRMMTWPNIPRWGCSTIGLVDSSGTLLSWQLKGDDCMAGYSDQELQKIRNQLVALQSLAPTLKRGTHLQLSFYDGAVDSGSHVIQGNVDGYFVGYSKLYGEITIRKTKERKHTFNLSKDNTIYELRYISDIRILKDNNP